MRLTYKAQDQQGKETGTVWYSSVTGGSIFPKSDNEEQALKKLATYEDAEEQEQLVILPCKVGDMVYALWSVPTPTKYVTYLAEVKEIRIAKRNTRTMLSVLIEPVEFRGRRKEYFADDFGKLIFLTREEAEAALKGGRADASNT